MKHSSDRTDFSQLDCNLSIYFSPVQYQNYFFDACFRELYKELYQKQREEAELAKQVSLALLAINPGLVISRIYINYHI